MNLTNDQKQLLEVAVRTVNKAGKQGKWEEKLVFENGVILTLTAKSPALVEEEAE